jgi:DNA-binding SARP family transcriptional activator
MACTTSTPNLGASTAASTSRKCGTSTGASKRRPGMTQARAEAWRTCGRCGRGCVGAFRSALPRTGRDGSRSQERPRTSEIEGSSARRLAGARPPARILRLGHPRFPGGPGRVIGGARIPCSCPFEVFRGETEIVPPAAARERALLLFLLLQANEIVPAESVIDGVWGDRPPRCAGNALHNGVSHLRKLLEPGACASAPEVLLTRPPGYLLRVGCEQLDSARLETILEHGRQVAERGALEQAANLLRKGERLRGPALADFRFEQFARSEIARLEELRVLTIADRVEVELAFGRHALLVCELTRLVGDHPFNERFRGQLMLALYRCGRQAEALAAFRETRRGACRGARD